MANRVRNTIPEGIDRVERERERNMRSAMREAVLFVQQAAQRITPVDTGNLQNSAFSEVESPKLGRVGFQAAYAAAVHEAPRLRSPKGVPQFLRVAMDRSATEVRSILKRRLRS